MTKNTRLFLSVALVAAVMNVAGCSKEDPKMPTQNTSDYRQIALVFVSSMAARDYVKAYCVFHANWTAVPLQTGHLFRRKLDGCSKPNWTVGAKRRAGVMLFTL